MTRVGGEAALGFDGGVETGEHLVQNLHETVVLHGVGVRLDLPAL